MATVRNLMKMFCQAVKIDKVFLFLFMCHIVLMSAANMILIYIPKMSADLIFSGFENMNLLYLTILFIVLDAVFEFAVDCIQDFFNNRIFAIRYGFIGKLSKKFTSLDYSKVMRKEYIDKGTFAFKAMKSNDIGIQGILREVFGLFTSVITVFLMSAVILKLHFSILFCCVAPAIFSVFLQKARNNMNFRFSKEITAWDRKTENMRNLIYDIRNGKELRIYGAGNLLLNKYNQLMEKQRKERDKNLRQNHAYEACGMMVEKGAALCIYVILIYFYFRRNLTLGDFVLFSGAGTNLTLWLRNAIAKGASVVNNSKYINSYYEFLDLEDKGAETEKQHMDSLQKMTIEFRNVSFRYPQTSSDALKNVSLTIHSGEKVALVGMNGAGKSTLVSLLVGLYEPTEGEILVNGVNMNRYHREEYWSLIAPLFQDINIYAFDVRQNVSLGERSRVDINKVEAGLAEVGLLDKMKKLRQGLGTMLTKEIDPDGVQLSGGESQRLAFSRTLYRDKPLMLVLDEPSAALDPLAEAALYQDFLTFCGNRAALFISHRLASVSVCERIILLKDGEVLETGTHTELMAKNGEYAELYRIQSEFYHSCRGSVK